MNIMHGVKTVLQFELRRSLKFKRGIWWLLLTAFPPALMILIVSTAGRPPGSQLETVGLVSYVLCPGVVSILGVFLWATPWLSSELEGRSWVYPAVRPNGAWAVLFGKYLAAVIWTIPAGLIAATASILIISSSDYATLIATQSQLIVLSCFAYGALFALIGTLFPKRAMVSGIFITIVLEVILSSVPAAINMVTIQYRLRCLLVRMLGLDQSLAIGQNPAYLAYFGDESMLWHFTMLLLYTVVLLALAAVFVRSREFTSDASSDV